MAAASTRIGPCSLAAGSWPLCRSDETRCALCLHELQLLEPLSDEECCELVNSPERRARARKELEPDLAHGELAGLCVTKRSCLGLERKGALEHRKWACSGNKTAMQTIKEQKTLDARNDNCDGESVASSLSARTTSGQAKAGTAKTLRRLPAR